MNLAEIKEKQSAVLTEIGGQGALRQHFLDMGLIPGTRVTYVKAAPMGDPIEYRIWDYELTLRLSEAEQIKVTDVQTVTEDKQEKQNGTQKKSSGSKHPGLGEMGIYHVKQRGEKIGKDELLTFGLAGNQNCGKTTLFNQLTGSNQHVGNFPGVTVDRKDGPIRNQENTLVTDLPGIYSMSPYTSEEIVSREFFLKNRPRGIINIVDATNIERNLYLTLQLIELDIPMVLALNMMDEVRDNGGTIDINLLEDTLGIPVVPISAAKNEGIDELVAHAVHVARYRERPGRMDFCDAEGADGGAMHRCIHSIMHLIEDHAHKYKIPTRFAASKLVEGDKLVEESLHLDQNELEMIEHIISQMETESGMDRQAALANMRFTFIHKVCDATVVRPHESKEHIRSQKMDKILTGKYTAIPVFAGIMILIFYFTFGLVGKWLSELLNLGIGAFTNWVDQLLTLAHVNGVVHSLVIDGIFAGVGSVLGFLPTIVTLFFFLSLLEDSGYMARIAFVMDKLLRKIGLSGRSFVPMIIGFGCSVPAIMATRTLPSERDRKMTVLLTPFMSCSAKMPIYAFFAAAFFPGKSALVMTILYFTGIVVGIAFAWILDHTTFRGEPVPFVMELPNYRFPSAKSVGRLIWDKAKDFLTRAFTIIFLATIIIWFLQSFDTHLNIVTDSKESILALIGSLIAPIFAPLGFGNWKISTALITGFMAKESVVSTLTVLSAIDLLTPFTAAVFLVFTLLYTPCVAAIASVKRELGGKWAAGVAITQCVIAWIVALIVRLIGLAIGLG
ncbi:MAG: ferrous iron transport protein B [Lachnobacterium sp.]|nr:ferrous iron transport protein B [Lachnobacterium sp.]MDD7713662.1 ferrous iron transport protein B [Lachnobacterium sp.]